MTTFTDEYKNLLITQYFGKPKAQAEILMKSAKWEEIKDFLYSFLQAFDIDYAVGVQQDIIGKIIGRSRNVPSAIQKTYFGFDTSTLAEGFADKFDEDRPSAPFYSKYSPTYSSLQLEDEEYRKWQKIKVKANHCSSKMVSDEKVTLQEIIQEAFDGEAYLVDNYDMTVTINVNTGFDSDLLSLIQNLDILPVPAGVRIEYITV